MCIGLGRILGWCRFIYVRFVASHHLSKRICMVCKIAFFIRFIYMRTIQYVSWFMGLNWLQHWSCKYCWRTSEDMFVCVCVCNVFVIVSVSGETLTYYIIFHSVSTIALLCTIFCVSVNVSMWHLKHEAIQAIYVVFIFKSFF